MKVIRRGKLPEERKWLGDCRNCNSTIETTRTELKSIDQDRDGPIGRGQCPVCNQEMCFYPRKT